MELRPGRRAAAGRELPLSWHGFPCSGAAAALPGEATVLPASKANRRLSSGCASTCLLRYCPAGITGERRLTESSGPGGETRAGLAKLRVRNQPTPLRSLPPGRTRPLFGGAARHGSARLGSARLGAGPSRRRARPVPPPRRAQRQQPERRHHLGGAGLGSPVALRVSLAAFSCLHPPRSSLPSPSPFSPGRSSAGLS